MSLEFTPGDLVLARGREWVALPSPDEETLYLRPLSGAEADVQVIHPALEREPVRPASFALPSPDDIATQEGARLLGDALRLSLRRGAGPFRSAARLSFEPRAYQLVPLLMALRLLVVRLLIADDVGIGKTIEAGLILRELIDRGEADRFAVLCPPHLVEQWTGELSSKFDLDAVAVTAASASRLERGLPASQTLFDAYPATVVSLDYIKAERRRDSFARACPPLVIVDEAHACVGTHKGRQQRFELLRRLAEDRERHLILLTATPHSGDEAAFDRLLSLLDEGFASDALDSEAARIRLARHFVQRRRIDITGRDWGEERTFPRHETAERPYSFTPDHQAFHDAVLDYCLGVVEGAGPDQRRRRLAFWGTLALMRCVGSSPAAAASALRNRLIADPERLEEQVFDDDADENDAVDVEPAPGLEEHGPLTALVAQAERLTKLPDPKLDAVAKLLKPLIADGANPVVFCRYIATADHVAAGLRKAFPKLRIEAVTGELTPDERRARVEDMRSSDQRLLVATDCLSEGINLQDLFDAVVQAADWIRPSSFSMASGCRRPKLPPLDRTADVLIQPEDPPGFVVRTEAQKAAWDNGFRLERGIEKGWLCYASTTAPGTVWIGGVSLHGPWLLAIDHAGVAAELDALPRLSIPAPGIATFALETLSELHAALDRVYRLAVSLPEVPLDQFRTRTAGLPQTTEAERLVVQRVGQDIFRDALMSYWGGRCPLTGITEPELLRASHIVPWAECGDEQRLDVHNGLLLSALWDAAFDKGLVSFGDDGTPLVSPLLSDATRKALGLDATQPIVRLQDTHRANLAVHRLRYGF